MSLRRLKGTRKIRQTNRAGVRRDDSAVAKAIQHACEPVIAIASGWDLLEGRVLMAANPVIVYNFDEGVTDPAATTVVNTGSSGATQDGTLAGDVAPTFGGATDDGTRSPAGGSFLHFAGDEVYNSAAGVGSGGRVDVGSDANRATWLHPILGKDATLAFWIRTNQASPRGEIWASPAVTGNENTGAADDVFYGDITNDQDARIRGAAGNGAVSVSNSPVNTGQWIQVTQTRNMTTGQFRTYVNGVLESAVTSETGTKDGVFRAIGALSVSESNDPFTIRGYNYLNGDLDQVEIYNAVLTPQEVAQKYGPAAAAPPDAPVISSLTSPGPRSALIQWGDIAGELGYIVTRSSTATGTFAEVATLAPDTTSFTDTSVTTGQQYFYKVQAFNAAGTSTSAAAGPVTIASTGNGLTAYYFNSNFWNDAQAGVADINQRPNSAFDAGGGLYPTVRIFGNPDITEGVPNVAFDFGNNNGDVNVRPGGSPNPAIRDDNFSTLFVGKIVAPETGTYRFLGFGDDDTNVFVNGVLVSSDPLGHGFPANNTAGIATINYQNTVDLVAGETYDIQVMQSEGGGGAGVFLRWFTPSMTDAGATVAADVPQSVLRTTVEPAQAATDLAVDPTGPDNAVTINFNDVSTRELHYDLERSVDGTTWTVVNDRGINATSIQDNNPLSVPAQYRVVAVNFATGGRVASAPITVDPPAPASNPGATGYYFYDQWWNSRAPAGSAATDIVVGRNPDVTENVGDISEFWDANTDARYDPALSGPGGASPHALIRDDRFSTVFTGKITFPEPGTYTVLGYSDDDSAIWIDSVLASSDPGGHGVPDINRAGDFGMNDIPIRTPITITQADIDNGTNVKNFLFTHSEGGGGAGATMRWITPSEAAAGNLQPQVVPDTALTSLPDLPLAPANLTAPIQQSRVAVLRWTDASNSEVRYSVARAPADASGAATGAFAELALLPIGTTSYTDNSVQKNQNYVYRVQAENFRGVAGTTVPVTSLADEPVPATPTNLAVYNLNGRNFIMFTDNANNETGFILERRLSTDPDSAYFVVSGSPLAQNGPGNTGTITFTDADPLLNPAATYTYRVRSVNIEGETSPNVEATALPNGLKATIVDPDTILGARNLVEGSNPFDPIVRTDPWVNFDFGNGSPDPRIGADTFAIAWEGVFTAPESGDFTFFGESDDGMRVFLDGRMIVDAWVDRGPAETSSASPPADPTATPPTTTGGVGGPITLVAGQRYGLQVLYYENGGGAAARLRYQGPTTAKQIIQPAQFSAPDSTIPMTAPFSVAAVNTLADCVQITWVDGNSNETGFAVQRNTDPSNEAGWTTVATVPANQQMYLDDPEGGTSYSYRVVPMQGATAGPASPVADVTTGAESAGPVNYPNFSDQASRDAWTLTASGANNGALGTPGFVDTDADGTEDTLRLTAGGTTDAFDNQTGAAFLNDPRHVNGFTSTFDFVMGGTGNQSANPADGFMFVIQNDPRGTAAIGGGGGMLGWGGAAPAVRIANSVGIKFDVFNNIDETGLYVNGADIVDGTGDARNRNLRTAPPGSGFAIDLNNGSPLRATITYDPVTKVMTLGLDDIGNAATTPVFHSWFVDLANVIGGGCAYVGFTGAAGGESVRTDIKNFAFTPAAPAPYPTLSVANVTMNEGNSGTSNMTFTVTLSAPSTQPIRVSYATSNSTATAGAAPNDYTNTSGTLTFAPGETSKTVNVPIVGDTVAEPHEAFFFTLSNPVNAGIGNGRAIGAIMDDDRAAAVTPSATIGDVTVAEGNTGTTNAVFTVTLSSAASGPVTIQYATADGTATAGTDYTATSGTLTIPSGATSGTITVPVSGDLLFEPNETFFVNLSGPSGATISDNQALGTITNDDVEVLPTLSINDVTVTEGNTGTTNATFTITLSQASLVPVTVDFATADGTGTAGSDYTAGSGTVTFAPGETSKTVDVAVLGDTSVEPDETFTVALSAPAGATIADGSGTGTITNDDAAPPVAVVVTQVFVGGPGLNGGTPTLGQAAFRNAAGIDNAFGYPIPDGATQLRSIPWTSGISTVSLRFDGDVATDVDQLDLAVRGSGGDLGITGFTYDAPSKTATWTLGSTVTLDKLRLVLSAAGVSGLDGEWTNPSTTTPAGDTYPSGDGTAGGDFNFRINVLRGDATGDGVVNALDVADVKKRLTRRPGDGVTGSNAYSIFADVNADGVVNALDVAAVKARLGNRITTLPDPAGLTAASGSTKIASITRDLFGASAIL